MLPFLPAIIGAGKAIAGSAIGKAALGAIGSGVGSAVANKVTGVPTPGDPMSGAEAGAWQRDFNQNAYPGTTAWEQLGSSGAAGQGGVDIAAKNEQKLQARELTSRAIIADMNNRAHILAAVGATSPQAAKSLSDAYSYGGDPKPYDTTVQQHAAALPSQVRKTSGEADRAEVFGKAAKGAESAIASVASKAGTFWGTHVDTAYHKLADSFRRVKAGAFPKRQGGYA